MFQDDNGLWLTKQMLGNERTTGLDLDLFYYIQSTNEFVIYEFLKRETNFVDNINAHPMRYSWTGKPNDNKKKFITLWNVKQRLNCRLYLVSYSDNNNEKISIIEVLDLDINKGILAENKYCMSKNIFMAWLEDMNNYKAKHNNYLSDFKCISYGNEFFSHFVKETKYEYGKEFER